MIKWMKLYQGLLKISWLMTSVDSSTIQEETPLCSANENNDLWLKLIHIARKLHLWKSLDTAKQMLKLQNSKLSYSIEKLATNIRLSDTTYFGTTFFIFLHVCICKLYVNVFVWKYSAECLCPCNFLL